MKPKLGNVDYDTQVSVDMAIYRANRQGTVYADELHRLGLLLSPNREAEIKAETMQWLVNELRGWTPAEFLRRRAMDLKNLTPADMYEAIASWMQEHADAARSQA